MPPNSTMFKIDAPLIAERLAAVPAAARRAELDGYDGVFTFEGPNDPFLPLMLAAEHSERLELTTAIAVAFARSPMTVASTASDIHRLSHGGCRTRWRRPDRRAHV